MSKNIYFIILFGQNLTILHIFQSKNYIFIIFLFQHQKIYLEEELHRKNVLANF